MAYHGGDYISCQAGTAVCVSRWTKISNQKTSCEAAKVPLPTPTLSPRTYNGEEKEEAAMDDCMPSGAPTGISLSIYNLAYHGRHCDGVTISFHLLIAKRILKDHDI